MARQRYEDDDYEDDEDEDDYEERPRRRGRRRGGDYEEHRGTMILVLGLLGILVCAPLAIAAWVMGSGDLKKIKAGQMDPEGESSTRIGYILGIVTTVLMIIGVIIVIGMFALGAAFFGAAADAQQDAFQKMQEQQRQQQQKNPFAPGN